MANTDNKCADLEVRDYYTENGYDEKSSLGDLYELQGKTQDMYAQKQGKKSFGEFNIAEVIDFMMMNNHALVDELHEMVDAVGGIDDGAGNAAWKPWKSANAEIREKKLSDLSDNDMKELKMEFIDAMHFMFNNGLALGITSQEIYNYYLSKNEENWNRARTGY